MSTGIGITLTADDQQLLAILRSVEGKLDQLAGSASGSFGQAGAAAARAATQVKGLEAQTGMSAKAMNAAMRNVPAQFTDIITSLQGGQAPLTVLLQQGGQLKDMFGGIGPAFRALGGYVLGLVNPFTLAAAAVAVLTYGFVAGRNESAAHARALIETGNAAGVTASQLGAMAAQVGAATGASQSKAAEVMDMMVRAGVVGAGALRDFTSAAIQMERAGGQSVDETAKAFASLAKDPVAASKSLNEASNYLTTSLYAQIKAMQEQGRTAEAAALAQRAYGDAQLERAPKLEAQLGTMEKLWRGITDGIKGARDALLDIGRVDGTEQAVKKAQNSLQIARQGIYSRGQVPERMADLKALEQGAGYEALSASYVAQATEARKAGVKWIDEGNGYLSHNQKLGLDILRIQNESVKAIESGAATQAEVNQRIALTIQRADPGVNLQAIRDNEAQRLEILHRSQDEIARQRAMGEINERGQIEATTAVTLQGIAIRRAAVAAELAIVSEKQDSERKTPALSGQLALMDAERTTAQIKGRSDLTAAIYKQKVAIDAVVRAGQEETRQEQADYFVQESKAREAASLAVYEYTKAVADSGALLDMEASLMGKTRIEREKRLAQYRIEIDLREKLAAIDKTFGTDPAGGIERQRVREAAARQIAQVERRAYLDEWQRTWDALADGLTDALMRGFENGSEGLADFKKTIERTLKNIYLKPMVDGAVKSILGSVQGFVASAFDAMRGSSLGGDTTGAFGRESAVSALTRTSSLLGSFVSTVGGWMGLGGAAASGAGFSAAGGGAVNAYLTTGGVEGSIVGGGTGGAAGAVGTAGIGASVAAAMPYVALIVAASNLAQKDQAAGFNGNAARRAGDGLGTFVGVEGKVFAEGSNLLKSIGFNSQWADILSGATGMARFFGVAAPSATDQGISGTIGGGKANLQAYQDWHAKGGFFRRDESGTNTAALQEAQQAALNSSAKATFDAVKGWADTLHLPADRLASITQQVRVSMGDDAEKNSAAIAKVMQDYGEALANTLGPAIAPLRKFGESVSEALQRLSTLQTFSGDLNELGGVFSRVAGLSVDAREGFIAMAGGMDALRAQAKSFVENYYSRDEVAGVKAREIQDALKAVGITQDISTKDQFRALVEGVDVSSAQGQQQLATLLQAQGSFADIAGYLVELGGGSLSSAAQAAPAMGVLGGILSAPEQAQIDAINTVTGAVNEVRDAIVDLGQSMAGGGGATTYPRDLWETTVDTGP